MALVGAVLSGCGSAASSASIAPAAGHYPVASPPPEALTTPTASKGHYQLVAAGEPVIVHRAGAVAAVDVAGPDINPLPATQGQPPAQQAPGTLTVTVRPSSGRLDVAAANFLGLDQAQNRIALHADRPLVHADPQHPATLRLSAVFVAGHTTVTWQPAGRPLVTWDFVVELD